MLPSQQRRIAHQRMVAVNRAFSRALDTAMSEKAITALDLAYLTGVDNSTIGRYRAGKQEASISKAFLLAEALGLSLDAMLRPADSPRVEAAGDLPLDALVPDRQRERRRTARGNDGP